MVVKVPERTGRKGRARRLERRGRTVRARRAEG